VQIWAGFSWLRTGLKGGGNNRLRTLENVVLRNVFGSKREEVEMTGSSCYPVIAGLI